jgi:hypothetical protein
VLGYKVVDVADFVENAFVSAFDWNTNTGTVIGSHSHFWTSG